MKILMGKGRDTIGGLSNVPQIKSNEIIRSNFSIYRHQGAIIHYHLSLEIDGATKHWLIPNGPSLNPHDKRLAIMLDDRASWSDPRSVKVWDKGSFVTVGSSGENNSIARQIKDGNIKFVLNGKRLKGSFRLLQLKDRGKNLWMLIKGNDQYAVDYLYHAEDYSQNKAA